MAAEPTTPTRDDLDMGGMSGSEDTFEDAPDITPRPRAKSPDTSRSLTERRTSSATIEKGPGGSTPATAEDVTTSHPPAMDGASAHTVKENGLIAQEEKAHAVNMSDMDEVNLGGDAQASTAHSRTATQLSAPLAPPEDSSRASSTTRSISPSKTMPPSSDKVSPLPAVTRGFKSPFSWLSRNTSGDKKAQSPPPAQRSPPLTRGRQNTTASADLLVGQFKDEREDEGKRDSRDSLKDRFKEARIAAETGQPYPRDSAHIAEHGGAIAGLIARSQSIGLGVTSPPTMTPEEEKTRTLSSPDTGHGATESEPSTSAPAPVDWDLWQSVVYEGPAAVARTSPEEMEAAIASGIPHPIRGVVWQVLASSKNEDLERLYEELVARGTDKEKAATNGHLSLASTSSKDKDSIASSASSIHSEHSTPATTASAISPQVSPSDQVNDDLSNLQNGLMKVKTKTTKEELSKIQKLEKTIKRDLGSRTAFSKFEGAKDPDGLFSVCKAYALYDEAVGYAQGMNFIAQPLLLNMSRPEAFCLFVRLMSKYGMREMFIQDMPGLHKHLYQFERLLEDFEPAVYCHLNRRGVNANLYATQWFLTLFAYRFPLELVLRVYDLVLSEGLGAILKFGLVLIQRNRETLLEMKDMGQLCTFLKERIFDAYIDKQPSQKSILEAGFFGSGGGDEVYRVDMFVQDATSVKITPDMLQQYTAEWEEKERVEKEREAELESLRTQNSALLQKVRRLEQHVEKVDAEHVQAASELIRIQVENERLQDENETLEGKVEELKRVVERQTEEVEARMKADIEAVKQANQVVHARNRELEEENEETTAALVSLKLEHANLNSELEALRQKWNNMREMLNGK
ncbi:uncharacterized protein PV09_02728 [Verruconis gallopava]|uniref:GTPase-activating protein GYP5 n=1 Tax=Verruconis gallopava TaxID=253628 RepID=A0A0D1XU00_9PEZI|nr:uncharacterized protein PV09_02728 [Verruconis gallopava]KIW06256.1 hypothetical protein PV09_02728 [Verruconis gallopava]